MIAHHLLPTLLLVASTGLLAQAGTTPLPAVAGPRTGFLTEEIEVAGSSHRYVLYVPPDYRADRRWPLIVFLNGAGECGTDGQKQISVGLATAIRNDAAAWPFLVLFPQKPNRASAWEDHDELVMATLGKAREQYAVDDKQLFLTGLSQGGHGTWVIGARHPELWAAIAPICGYGDPATIAPPLKNMPVWCFHGEDDKAVPVEQSKDLCAAVEKAGGHPELTLYPGTGHNSWDKAYREAPLAEWLLAAASDRLCASYIARPELATRATIEVRDEWSTDAGVAHRGTTTVTLRIAKSESSWRIVEEYRDPKSTLPSPEPRGGKFDGRDGGQFLVDNLRTLQASGVFRLPAVIEPAASRGHERHSIALDVTLEGKPGSWHFHRDVPPDAYYDPEFDRAARSIVAFRRAMEALH